jgi:hypothetical protein
MKAFLRTTLLAAIAVCSFSSLSLVPAQAADEVLLTQNAQMRLASLGYYVGRYDGKMGPLTRTAIADFQNNNGLTVNGELTPETYSLLGQKEYMEHYAAVHYGYFDKVEPVVMWDDRWQHVRTQTLPFRFGKLDVTEDDRGGVRHYAVTLNGEAVILAKNQPSLLRVSDTFRLNNEDAVIFTAYTNDGVCTYKSYLLTMRSDGTHDAPREINNCSNAYEAHVSNGALFVSFAGGQATNGWTTWDVWRYEQGSLVRI